jgi:hypothetical protein
MASLPRCHRATVAALAMLATVPTTHAAKFWTEPGTCIDGSKTCIDVHMQGEIVKGDNARFNKAVAKVPKGKATIYLDSVGGEFLEGFPIAKTVRRQNWNTYVDHYCTSMCADIWLAGNVRYYRRLAQIGFHTVSQWAGKGSTAGVEWRGKYWVRNVVDDALVLKFFQEIGISAKTGRILLAPDLGHLTWVNGWGSDPALVASLDIKMTMWPKDPPNVVTVPATLASKLDSNLALKDQHLIPVDANGHPFPPAQRIAPQPVGQPPAQQSAPLQPEPQTATGPLIKPKIADRFDQPSSTEQPVAAVAQSVVLYDEDPSDPKGKQYVGSVVWRTEPVKASSGRPSDIAVRADIEVPDRKFKMTMSFRRNTISSLPASHTVELTFILPPDFAGGGVSNVTDILMKANEQARATPLAGLAVKVTDSFFLVGLSNVDADRSRNIQLLKERSWLEVSLVYANQRRAIIAIEKGAPGERAFKDALTAWGEDYPTASTAPQPVGQPPAQSDTAKPANSPVSSPVKQRTASSGARTSVQTYYSLTPDCNQNGTITVQVLKQPSQGTLEIVRDRGFTNYPADNIRAKCNAQEVELTRVWYKSNADFKGRDQAQLEAFFTSGNSIETTLQITVK